MLICLERVGAGAVNIRTNLGSEPRAQRGIASPAGPATDILNPCISLFLDKYLGNILLRGHQMV